LFTSAVRDSHVEGAPSLYGEVGLVGEDGEELFSWIEGVVIEDDIDVMFAV
jgi:hypothetical protein